MCQNSFFEKIPLLQIAVAGGFFQFGHYDTPSFPLEKTNYYSSCKAIVIFGATFTLALFMFT